MSQARSELVRLHRRFFEEIQSQLVEFLGPKVAELEQYEKRYRADLEGSTLQPITKRAMLEELAASDVVLIGDYHTLRQSQLSVARLLREFVRRGREVTLGLEMFDHRHQDPIVSYLNGTMDESEFLRQVDYEQSWGFSWDNYRVIVQTCIQEEIPIIPLSTATAGRAGRVMAARDEYAAQVIARESTETPDRLIVAVMGEEHLARPHLPEVLKRRFAAEDEVRKIRVLYQNSDEIYWNLLSGTTDRNADLFRLDRDRFAVVHCPPWLKLRSYLNWEDRTDELILEKGTFSGTPVDLQDQFVMLIDALGEFLDIDSAPLRDVSVYNPEDLEFFELALTEWNIPAERVERLKEKALRNGGCVLAQPRRVYLANIGISAVAERAGEYLYRVLSGGEAETLKARDEFYRTILISALSFFCSKVIHFRRKLESVSTLKTELARRKRRRLSEVEKRRKAVTKLALQHLDWERKLIRGGRRTVSLRMVYKEDMTLGGEIARVLGAVLGGELYEGVMDGVIERSEIRDMFSERWAHENQAFTSYIQLKSRLRTMRRAAATDEDTP